MCSGAYYLVLGGVWTNLRILKPGELEGYGAPEQAFIPDECLIFSGYS